jgi:hypothetical protein
MIERGEWGKRDFDVYWVGLKLVRKGKENCRVR